MQREHDEDDGLSPAQRELESALRSLSPAPRDVDPIAAAYEAGRRSLRWHVHAWQSAAALVLIALGATWLMSSLPSVDQPTPTPMATGPRVLVVQTRRRWRNQASKPADAAAGRQRRRPGRLTRVATTNRAGAAVGGDVLRVTPIVSVIQSF
jgi:hypothetical protein